MWRMFHDRQEGRVESAEWRGSCPSGPRGSWSVTDRPSDRTIWPRGETPRRMPRACSNKWRAEPRVRRVRELLPIVRAHDLACWCPSDEPCHADVLLELARSQHKDPCGGRGASKTPTDRGKLRRKWSLLTDRNGIPVSWAIGGAKRHDTVLFEPTLVPAAHTGLIFDVETLHLDRGCDTDRVGECAQTYRIYDLNCPKKRRPGTARTKKHVPLGLRWSSGTNQLLSSSPDVPKPPNPGWVPSVIDSGNFR